MSKIKVPVGYKQTEIGIIPENWKLKSYSEVFQFLSTASNSRADLSTDGDYGYIHYGDIHTKWDNLLDLDKYELPRIDSNKVSSSLVMEGDIIVADASEDYEGVGKSVEIKNISNDCIVSGLHTFLLRDKSDNFSSGFKGYIHSIPLVQSQFQRLATGLKVYGISKTNLKTILIPIPSKIEQTAIANTLTDTDNLIQSLEKLIAKKEAIKTGTMQQLLTGKTRLPEFATREDGSAKGFKQTELGKIPEDWDVVTIGESCDLLTGHPFSSSKYSDSGVRLLRGSNIKRGNTDWDTSITRYWPEITSNISHYALNIGDVVISMDGSLVGRSFAQLSESDLPALLLQRVARLRANTLDQNYLKEWVCSSIFTEHCDLVKTVTAIPHISPADILNFKIATPRNEKEQTAIATILSDMDAEIEALQDRLEKTKAIKQGMMQQLLTGKVRLV